MADGEKDVAELAKCAVEADRTRQVELAIFYYTVAAEALLQNQGPLPINIAQKAHEYINRAEQLKKSGQTADAGANKTQSQLEVERAKFLLSQALEKFESEEESEARELFTETAELAIRLKKELINDDDKKKMEKIAEMSLDGLEMLKKKAEKVQKSKGSSDPIQTALSLGPLGLALRDDDVLNPVSNATMPASSRSGNYSKEEINVLKQTSLINGLQYVPFMGVDVREKFAYPLPFTDPCGPLVLSPKQLKSFARWVRPHEIFSDPKMIYAISSFSIRQTIVSDCSFVASLAIAAQFERRFQKKIITTIIYPQNRNGEPEWNPCGKYMVKLHLNGIARKVIIDDTLPLGIDGRLLCSYSSNKNELWVSLLEKAYMKVMGGYNFPGSNSNIDLHALTGWIPDRVSVSGDLREFNADKEFDRIHDRLHAGHCLVTIATGALGEQAADRAGLVPSHAYAVLDIRKVKGVRLMQVKNPWSHLRWKGNYSELDVQHWTEEMKSLLNYDPESASTYDNGVFWIDYESVLKFFEVIYINWNPEIFPFTTCVHHTWKAGEGPAKDSYNMGDNPQYRLSVEGGDGTCALWILLSRHITDKEDFANNREFITVLVYKTGGKRIFYPHDPPPYRDGVRINSPHYLCQMTEKGERTGSNYTLVVSQYEKSNTIHYTLRVYSTRRFSLIPLREPYNAAYEQRVTGEWAGLTAGGCSNYPTHVSNPIYQIKIDNNRTDNQLLLELRGPKKYSVGMQVTTVAESGPTGAGAFKHKNSGDYRPGFCVLELEGIGGGVYNITVSTFRPQEEGPFLLNVSSTTPIKLSRLQ